MHFTKANLGFMVTPRPLSRLHTTRRVTEIYISGKQGMCMWAGGEGGHFQKKKSLPKTGDLLLHDCLHRQVEKGATAGQRHCGEPSLPRSQHPSLSEVNVKPIPFHGTSNPNIHIYIKNFPLDSTLLPTQFRCPLHSPFTAGLPHFKTAFALW